MCALHLSILALFSALLHKLSYSALVLLSLLAFVSSLLLFVLVLSLDLAPLVLSSNSLPSLCAMGLGTRHAEGTAPPSIIWVRGPKGVFNGWRPEQSSDKASTFKAASGWRGWGAKVLEATLAAYRTLAEEASLTIRPLHTNLYAPQKSKKS